MKQRQWLVIGIIAVVLALGVGLYTVWVVAKPKTEQGRTATLQIMAGVVVASVVSIGSLIAWQNLQVSRQGQITERFTRAIDQLGANDDDGDAHLEIRIGGIYALERIARDSDRDYQPIIETLTAYIRLITHASQSRGVDAQGTQASTPREDIAAILRVLQRRAKGWTTGEKFRLDLHETDLSGAELYGVNFKGAYLDGVKLYGAHLEEADLGGAHLRRADLGEAQLSEAHLSNAMLVEATLRGVNLFRATLREVMLSRADLREAHLMATDFSGADFSGADLRDADLRGAVLNKASLTFADLRGANLRGADLGETSLTRTDLRGANLESAKSLEVGHLRFAYGDETTQHDFDEVVWNSARPPD